MEPEAGDSGLEAIREDAEPGKPSAEAKAVFLREVDHQNLAQLKEEAKKRRDIYPALHALLRVWAAVVFAACLLSGLRFPNGEPHCTAPVALASWASLFAISLWLLRPARDHARRIIGNSPHLTGFCAFLVVYSWIVGIAAAGDLASERLWTPLDVMLAFELATPVLVALIGSLTAGAVSMFVVILKHYFPTHPKK